MAFSFSSTTPSATSFHIVRVNDNVTILSNLSERAQQTDAHNTSFRDDCFTLVSSEMDFLPWNNPDNIVSAEVETIVKRIKNNMLVLLFLIGGPANVINMAVFYKQGLRDRVNLCLFALSFADELYLITAMLCYAEQLLVQFTTQVKYGPLITFLVNKNLLFFGSNLVSPVLSAIIAVERCFCVLSPLRFQILLRTRTMAAIIIAVYVLVSGLNFLVLYRYHIDCVYDPISHAVEMTLVEGEFYKSHKEFIDRLDSFVFGVGLLGVAVMVVMISTIATIVKLRQAVRWRADTSSTISPREVALTKMLMANSVLFLICVFPDTVNHVSRLFLPQVSSGSRHYNFFLMGVWIGELFAFVNATFNICLYYSMGSRYRETFWAMFGRKMLPRERFGPTLVESNTPKKP